MKYNLVELKTNENVEDMWSLFCCSITKGPMELDVKISRSVDDIMNMTKHPESSGSV